MRFRLTDNSLKESGSVGIPNRGGVARRNLLLEAEGSADVLGSSWVACAGWTSQEFAMV